MHAICPYFAMFPEDFVREHLERLTSPGDWVLDPFSGRGTTLFQALLMERRAAAMDVNPVAYCATGAKAQIPSLKTLLHEIDGLEAQFRVAKKAAREARRSSLPPFFRRAFYWSTLDELLFLREKLNWEANPVHRFLAALALGSLHGERDESPNYFSNQMPRTISTKPDYSLRYWREHRLYPHKREVFSILRGRAEYRLHEGAPQLEGKVALADAREASKVFAELRGTIQAVITSPPYFDVTNFEEDQWLRLWFLGGEPRPTYGRISTDDRHTSKRAYWQFLREAWAGIAPLMRPDSVLVCRMGGKEMAVEGITDGLIESLASAFQEVELLAPPSASKICNRQTDAFRPGSRGCRYEWDYTFALGGRS